MLVYPNEFTLPLMPNFGLPPPPQGMLHIKVHGWDRVWMGWGLGGGGVQGVMGCAPTCMHLTCLVARFPVPHPPAVLPLTLAHLPRPALRQPPAPQVVQCTGLKGGIFDRMDPFVTLELRKGREAKVGGTNERINALGTGWSCARAARSRWVTELQGSTAEVQL